MIAAVNGFAIGGGHVLHVVCDLTIASETARFGQTGPRVGSFDAGFGTAYLARIVGEKRAREIWYLCRQYTAEQAMRVGLVNAVVAARAADGRSPRVGRRDPDEVPDRDPLPQALLQRRLRVDRRDLDLRSTLSRCSSRPTKPPKVCGRSARNATPTSTLIGNLFTMAKTEGHRLRPTEVAEGRPSIRMTNDRILVRRPGSEERKIKGGFLIPATAANGGKRGVGRGRGRRSDVRHIEPGDYVLVSPEAGYEAQIRGEDYLLLREREVHAIASEQPDSGTGLYL